MWEEQYNIYEELWLSDAIYALCNMIPNFYTEKWSYTDVIEWEKTVTEPWKKDIINRINQIFSLVEKKVSNNNTQENADVFSLLVIASIVSWKKVSYNSVKKLYLTSLKEKTQESISLILENKLNSENRRKARLNNEIKNNKDGILQKQLALSNTKEIFYNTSLAINNLEASIEKKISTIKELEQQKKELELKPQKTQEETDKIKEQIEKIEQSIKEKQRELKILEQQKININNMSFPWYKSEMSELEKSESLTKQKVQYWLDSYGQNDPDFSAQTVLYAVSRVESAINGEWSCTKTDFNERLQPKYSEALYRIRENNNPDYSVSVPVDYVMAFMFLESHFGKSDLSSTSKNPWNVKSSGFTTWQDGIEACTFNIAARILSYQDLFGISTFPTVRELYENKSESGVWFVIWTENRSRENPYRNGNVIKNWKRISWRLNPEWAYMPWYPWWLYVSSCYDKLVSMNKIHDASLEIYEQEQNLTEEWISESKRVETQKKIGQLKLIKKELENKLSELQKSELALENLGTDIDALWEQYAKELATAYAKQKEYEDKKTVFTAQSKDVLSQITSLNVDIDALLEAIVELDESKRKIALIKIERNGISADEEYNLDSDSFQRIQDEANSLYDDVNQQLTKIDRKFILPTMEIKSNKEIYRASDAMKYNTSYVKVAASQEELAYNEKLENAVPKKWLKSFKEYKARKSYLESRGNRKIYNRFWFMWKYQMGATELRGVGYWHIKFRNFKKDPNIFPEADQEIAYMRLQRLNKYFMRTHYHLIWQTIRGVYITEWVLVGGAGIWVGNVKNFLDHGIDKKDGMGIKTSTVMKLFQNYDVSWIVPMTYSEWQKLRNSHLKKKTE